MLDAHGSARRLPVRGEMMCSGMGTEDAGALHAAFWHRTIFLTGFLELFVKYVKSWLLLKELGSCEAAQQHGA